MNIWHLKMQHANLNPKLLKYQITHLPNFSLMLPFESGEDLPAA